PSTGPPPRSSYKYSRETYASTSRVRTTRWGWVVWSTSPPGSCTRSPRWGARPASSSTCSPQYTEDRASTDNEPRSATLPQTKVMPVVRRYFFDRGLRRRHRNVWRRHQQPHAGDRRADGVCPRGRGGDRHPGDDHTAVGWGRLGDTIHTRPRDALGQATCDS